MQLSHRHAQAPSGAAPPCPSLGALHTPASPGARFPAGPREDRAGGTHEAGLSTPKAAVGRGPSCGAGPCGASARPLPCPGPAPRSAFGASRAAGDTLRPALAPAHLPQIPEWGFPGTLSLSAVTFPSFAGLEPELSDYGCKAGLSQQDNVFSRPRLSCELILPLVRAGEGMGRWGRLRGCRGSESSVGIASEEGREGGCHGAHSGSFHLLLLMLVLSNSPDELSGSPQGSFPVRPCASFSSPCLRSCPAGRNLSLLFMHTSAS